MPILNRGFRSRRQPGDDRLPPGQHLADGFPVLTAGPTPRVPTDTWRFVITDAARRRHTWSWDDLMRLPREQITADIHCVTKWSKLGTRWEGVSLDTLFESVPAVADHALVHTYDAYTTNVPLGDLLGAKAWLAYRYEGAELDPGTAGPPGCSCRTCTCGSRRSGSEASTCSTTTSRGSGRCGATTTTAIRGGSSGTPATDPGPAWLRRSRRRRSVHRERDRADP